MNLNNFVRRRTASVVLIVTVAVAVAVWWLISWNTRAALATASQTRKVLFYQSPMHPWVKSDKPGKCTVCGMELVPVYEGGQTSGPATDIVDAAGGRAERSEHQDGGSASATARAIAARRGNDRRRRFEASHPERFYRRAN